MKTLLSAILFFLIATCSQAQVCNEYRLSHVNDTTNYPFSYGLTYTAKGLPASRIYYVPGTQNISFIQNYYYTGTRLDSLMGYINSLPVGQIFTYDTSGNLTGIQNIDRYRYVGLSSTFIYENNQLTGMHIRDLDLKCSDIIHEGNSIKTASFEFYPYGPPQYYKTCTFLYDSLPNPLYNKIGIVDNPLLYLTPKTFLGLQVNDFKPYLSQNVGYYKGTNLISRISYNSMFTDAVRFQSLGYTYSCISPALFLDETLIISPNPSSAGLYKMNLENAKFKVYTHEGQLILENSNSLIDLSAQQPGIYLLHIYLPEGKKVIKLFKN
ncbi:MAG: T9SS type A sorting domain-containing protein [Opitutaceae bacterium]|nr:T9SS type A sorting domain-containing protein [Cytophagales bacterium]